MNKKEFLSVLAEGLNDMPEGKLTKILFKYQDYFNEMNHLDEEEIIKILGDPYEIVYKYRDEYINELHLHENTQSSRNIEDTEFLDEVSVDDSTEFYEDNSNFKKENTSKFNVLKNKLKSKVKSFDNIISNAKDNFSKKSNDNTSKNFKEHINDNTNFDNDINYNNDFNENNDYKKTGIINLILDNSRYSKSIFKKLLMIPIFLFILMPVILVLIIGSFSIFGIYIGILIFIGCGFLALTLSSFGIFLGSLILLFGNFIINFVGISLPDIIANFPKSVIFFLVLAFLTFTIAMFIACKIYFSFLLKHSISKTKDLINIFFAKGVKKEINEYYEKETI